MEIGRQAGNGSLRMVTVRENCRMVEWSQEGVGEACRILTECPWEVLPPAWVE